MISTGVAKLTYCQPEAVSLVKVAWARRVPAEVHRLPTWVPVFVDGLVEADAGDLAVCGGGELHADLKAAGFQRIGGHRRREVEDRVGGRDGAVGADAGPVPAMLLAATVNV